MKALCRRCRTTGPASNSIQESRESVAALGWTYSKRNGFACPDCQGKPPAPKARPSKALIRAYRVTTFLEVAVFAALAALVVIELFL